MGVTETIMLIVGIVLGGGIGGVITYLIATLKNKVKIATLEKEVVDKQIQCNKLIEDNAKLTQKCLNAESALSNTLAALELLKAYQMIDNATKEKIKDLENTFKDGKATPESIQKYKEMIQQINDKYKKYNNGQSQATSVQKDNI